MTSKDEVTPADLRALSAVTEKLHGQVTRVYDALRADPETKDTAYRLGETTSHLYLVAYELGETASDLARVRTARDPGLCGVPWGVCPEHGNTLASSGGESWCTVLGCKRRWSYDRSGTPCQEKTSHKVTDAKGDSFTCCAVHAANASERLDGCTVAPVEDAPAG